MLGLFEFGISVFRDDVFEYYYQTFSYYHPQSVMLTTLSGPSNGDTLVSLQSTTNPFLYSTDLHCEFGTNLADAALTNLHVPTCLTPNFDLGQNEFVEIPAFLYRGGTECLNASGGTECLNACRVLVARGCLLQTPLGVQEVTPSAQLIQNCSGIRAAPPDGGTDSNTVNAVTLHHCCMSLQRLGCTH